MSTAGWIFLVGMRVFDLGGMVVWLVWYFRHRDEPDDDWRDWDDWDDPSPDKPSPRPEGPGVRAPLPDAGPWPLRIRDHTAPRPQRADRRSLPARRERERERERP